MALIGFIESNDSGEHHPTAPQKAAAVRSRWLPRPLSMAIRRYVARKIAAGTQWLCASEREKCAMGRGDLYLEPRAYRRPSQATSARAFGRLAGPGLIWIRLERIDVNHPVEHLREPAPARLLASILGRDGAFGAEFLPIYVLNRCASLGQAKIDMLVPARHAERNAHVQLIVG